MTAQSPAHDISAWRSLLFVPANVPRFVDKAAGLDVDIVILDLEDSIAPDAKGAAREAAVAAATRLKAAGRTVVVRINQPLELAVRDIEAVVSAPVSGLMLPKIAGPDHVRLLSELVGKCERAVGLPEGKTRFIVIIESCEGFAKMREIAAADPRLFALMLGSEDFTAALGAYPDPEVLAFPKQQMLIAARGAGLVPLGTIGSIANFDDIATFRQVVKRSRRYGFEGATVIHPNLVPALNEGFTPDSGEVEQAQRIVAAYEDAYAKGIGAIAIDGKMVDVPIVARAQDTLRRAGKTASVKPH
jgi:citrate lyase subunit beta/citryl-CoA lyase